MSIVNEEPVAIATLVGGFLSLLAAFGVPLTADQTSAAIAFIVAAAAWWARRQVTPVSGTE